MTRDNSRPQQETVQAGPKLASNRSASASEQESQAIGESMLYTRAKNASGSVTTVEISEAIQVCRALSVLSALSGASSVTLSGMRAIQPGAPGAAHELPYLGPPVGSGQSHQKDQVSWFSTIFSA